MYLSIYISDRYVVLILDELIWNDVGTSESIPVTKGEMRIGTYQNIIVVSAKFPLYLLKIIFVTTVVL